MATQQLNSKVKIGAVFCETKFTNLALNKHPIKIPSITIRAVKKMEIKAILRAYSSCKLIKRCAIQNCSQVTVLGDFFIYVRRFFVSDKI